MKQNFYQLKTGLLTVFLALGVTHAKRPNVIFLAVDDMNDWIGCLNTTPGAITPNIDKLARRGVNFSNAHTPGTYCAPARAAIFSGQFASTTGCYETADYFSTRPELEGLQTSFSKAGYSTLGAGKLFHHREGSIDVRGWDEFFLRKKSQRLAGWTLDSWSEETPFPDPFPASIFNKGKKVSGGLFLEWAGLPNEKEEEMADTIRINWAVDQLKKEHDKPFFLACGIYAPHFPNYCPQKYFDLYDRDEIELPPYKADDLDDLPERMKRAKTGRSKIHKELESKGAVKDAIHGYLACMSYADAMMGRVLDALAESPYADNTIVVLWSDHGYHHGEKYDWGKHTLWERTSNVPFIWAGPGVAKGVKTDVTASLIDMYPTFVEMCNLPLPHQKLEGTSLVSTLAKPDEAKDRDVYLPYMAPGEYAIINKDWRYISYGEDGEELYDLRNDPNEWFNLADKPEHVATKETLRKSAPKEFAPANPKRNYSKDLIIEGESFRWRKLDEKNSQIFKKKVSGEKKKKNVLLIVCDDLNTHVTPSGYEHILTPTMKKFADTAMTFKRAFCQYPVCGPSRASLLHGLYPESTGVLDNKVDIRQTRPGTVSIPQFFKERGYWTGEVGKVFHTPRHNQGEVAWSESHFYRNEELPVVTKARKKFEAENGSVELPKNRKAWRELSKQVASKLDAQTPPGYGRSGLADDQHKDGKNARTVAGWLREKPNGKKPFFIACGIQKPHVPFLAPSKYFDLYPLDKIVYTPDRPDLWETIPRGALNGRFKEFGFELGKENDALRREYMQAYHACVSFIDAQLKLVMDALEESGEVENTIVILISDHGYHLGDHFMWGKVSLFDIGARVPFMIRVPGLTKPHTESQAMIELIDIFPTLTQLTGFERPAQLQGVSLRPLLDHPERLGKKNYSYTIVKRGEKMGYALRNQKWRYAKWQDGEELYNLTKDPEEKVNLANRENLEHRLIEFRRVLKIRREQATSRRSK